jgi:hypothetical protein
MGYIAPAMENAEPGHFSLRRARTLKQLDRLVASGRLTTEEAERLRRAEGQAEFEAAVGAISLRHATAQVEAAVKAGVMTEDEANASLARIENGGHSRSARAHLSGLLRRKQPHGSRGSSRANRVRTPTRGITFRGVPRL